MVMPAPPRDPGWRPNTSGLMAMVLVLGVVVGIWFLSGGDPGTPTSGGTGVVITDPTPSGSNGATGAGARSEGPRPGSVDPQTGLTWVSLDSLPPEAADTVEAIATGGPFLYDQDGATFENREGVLPDRPPGAYAEYTVITPGSSDRGARRIVAGDPGELFWTADHYDSFERIIR